MNHMSKALALGLVLASVACAAPQMAKTGSVKRDVAAPQWEKVPVTTAANPNQTGHQVELSWKSQPGVIAYDVFRSTESGKGYMPIGSTGAPPFIDTKVEQNTTYFYVVTAQDKDFNISPSSAEQRITTPAVAGPQSDLLKPKPVKVQVKARQSRFQWARARGAGFALWEPYDIEVDEMRDLLYVTSNNTNEVYVLSSSTGSVVRVLNPQGTNPTLLQYPLGLGLDAQGNLYVADRDRQSVVVFDAKGTFLRELPLKVPAGQNLPTTVSPVDVAVDSASGDIFVSDRDNSVIWVLDQKGAVKKIWGEQGIEPGQLTVSLYLRLDKAGNLVIVNGSMMRIDTFTKEGKFISTFGGQGTDLKQFRFIGGFAFDPQGNVLVVDKGGNICVAFTRDGRYLYSLADMEGNPNFGLYTPKAVAADSRGRVFIVEGLKNQISSFQLLGNPPEPQEAPPVAPAAPRS